LPGRGEEDLGVPFQHSSRRCGTSLTIRRRRTFEGRRAATEESWHASFRSWPPSSQT
jgi:hypothetical protein